jgi:predicted amidohydrolase
MSLAELKVTAVQMTSLDQAQANLEKACFFIEKACAEFDPDLICFPENALYLRLKEGEKVPQWSPEDQFFFPLLNLAREKKVHLHFGSVPAKSNLVDLHNDLSPAHPAKTGSREGHKSHESGKGYNASLYISDQGQAQFSYHKIHLFDIQLEGKPAQRESDVFDHGKKPSVLDIAGWKIGQSICYDIRFSELYLYYAQQGVDLILIPAAFLVPTGQAHWHVLNRARAIESQAYVVSAAQAGVHESPNGRRETFGHTLVVDPWGRVLAEGSSLSEELIHVTLQRGEIEKVRRQIPMAQHRRLKSF